MIVTARDVFASTRAGSGSLPTTLTDLLYSCPTTEDVRRVTDLPIRFELSLLRSWSCSWGGIQTSVELSVLNQFRIMAAMKFDQPIPLLGTTNVYDWILSLISKGQLKEICYVNGAGNMIAGLADLGSKTLRLDASPFSEPWTRMTLDPLSGMSAIVPVGLLIHEARHLEGFVHECKLRSGNSDRSLAYGGAFAASYWWALWCADHSGNFLPASVRDNMRSRAASMRETVFCE